uniref:Putative secreted protein n=1 Tax=Amblyomma tuberculatum TaxID=48802 RepID=A0A6M2E1B7_9ACAR
MWRQKERRVAACVFALAVCHPSRGNSSNSLHCLCVLSIHVPLEVNMPPDVRTGRITLSLRSTMNFRHGKLLVDNNRIFNRAAYLRYSHLKFSSALAYCNLGKYVNG